MLLWWLQKYINCEIFNYLAITVHWYWSLIGFCFLPLCVRDLINAYLTASKTKQWDHSQRIPIGIFCKIHVKIKQNIFILHVYSKIKLLNTYFCATIILVHIISTNRYQLNIPQISLYRYLTIKLNKSNNNGLKSFFLIH